jgi:hypothetical protein
VIAQNRRLPASSPGDFPFGAWSKPATGAPNPQEMLRGLRGGLTA